MKSPDELLADDKHLRRRREYQRALTIMAPTTKGNRWGGLLYILFASPLVFFFIWHFSDDAPLTKAEGVTLIICALGTYRFLLLGMTQLCRNPRDVALYNLIEERLEQDKKGDQSI
jgi:hypothetical protein